MDAVPQIKGMPSGPFRLQGLLVDPESGAVSGPNGSVRIEPRAAALLSILARTPGELVSRQSLLDEIWPGGEIYDDALTQCVYQLRQHLVEVSGDQNLRKLIKTIPKRGFQLQATVEPVDGAVTVNKMRPIAYSLPVSFWLLFALLAGIGIVLAWNWYPDATAPNGPAPASIAVLPFLPLVETHSNPVLEQGMADTLIARLGEVRGTVVRPISSARYFNAPDRDPLAAGRELGVDSVVDGSVQRADGMLRVNARLLRVVDGTALWSGSFEQPFTQVFTMQDAIASRIASALALHFDPNAVTKEDRGTSNPQAYDLYLEGRYRLSRMTREGMLESLDLFYQAVAIDPGYVQAWLGLAHAHFRLPIISEVPPMEHYPRAKQAAQRALEINPDQAEAYAYLGWIAQWYDWDWEASEAHFLRAIELNPQESEAHLGYGHLLSITRRTEAARMEFQRAREISPLYVVGATLEGGFLIGNGWTEEGARVLEQAIRMDPGYWLAYLFLSGAYSDLGRHVEAASYADTAGRLNKNPTWAMVNDIGRLVGAGQQSEAEVILAGLLQRERERYVPPYDIAVSYRILGDLDNSLAWLQRAREVRDPKMLLLATRNWESQRLQPGFAEIIDSMNFPHFQRGDG